MVLKYFKLNKFFFTFLGGPFSERLNYVDLYVYPNEGCSLFHGKGLVIESSICAIGVTNNPSGAPCVGDSGSPMVINENETFTQIGIMSFGKKNLCESGQPTVFTRTSSFLNWISGHTGIVIPI